MAAPPRHVLACFMFIGGVAYIAWYKKRVLDKIELAFAAGYDPALDLANNHAKKAVSSDQTILEELVADGDDLWTAHLRRKEQDALDAIVHGLETGHYFMLLGPKGAGKTTMVIDAMRKNQAEGVAMCDAHPDLEVFRLRLGKALNFEYNEDSQTGVFQRRDPRGPALDIERAFNKLEKVAIRVSRRTGRPLVLIINNIHHFKNDDEGRNMLLQLQQRAEGWSASGTLTMVFSTDDFWPFHEMRKTASRMHVMYIPDLSNHEAFHAARRMRLDARRSSVSDEEVRRVIGLVGGRLAYLSKVAKARDMEEYAQHMLDVEKGWLLSQIGLIPDCDDDVMDEQKWSSCSWLLLREFVRLRMQQEHELGEQISSGEVTPDGLETLPLPSIPYYKCRQIMTRADFLEDLDRMNIISIDVHHNVQPDSMLILHVARSVVEEDGFDELLDGVRDRIDEIESLHRTRELTFKDLDKGDRIRLAVDKTATILDNDD
ncbi:hypothetical protein PUNSTDRAFT_136530 [Punctularia strigosozonata HHB-11173 SS5]|uniref:uncharacterized protein n=1 Tax=Punctularia strigosozonata (strain HHB-11173) TaxID=741275 RepID=UPI0004416DE9|nr:uncharacterized protein PUNSTDRAFT_136530 [Punctularia strigosozonata HHB-11173 SS5]EIN06689.1 hypothetical protein PUNSTDRAFT_136530 [Punctularia strigosozonata HHB-11173 SS5]